MANTEQRAGSKAAGSRADAASLASGTASTQSPALPSVREELDSTLSAETWSTAPREEASSRNSNSRSKSLSAAALPAPGSQRQTSVRRSRSDPQAWRSSRSSGSWASSASSDREAERESRVVRERKAKLKAWLVRHGYFNVNVERQRFGRISYPLHTAVRNNDPEMVRLLLQAGANPFNTTTGGRTAEALARRRNWLGARRKVLEVFAQFAAGELENAE